MEISYTKVFAGHPVLSFSPWMTVSPDPLTNVTVTLPFLWLAGWLCHRQQDWLTTKSFRHSTEWAEQDAAVSWTKTSPGDGLQLESKLFQAKGAWPRNILVLRSRETVQFQKRFSSSGFAPIHHVHQGSWRMTRYAMCNRHIQSYSQAFLQCAALGYAQTHCNSAASRSPPVRLRSTRVWEDRGGPSCLWRTTWVSPNIPSRNHI